MMAANLFTEGPFAMVSALTSTRLVSAQLALQMLQFDQPTSSDDSSSSLLGSSSSLSSLPSQSQASLTSLLNGLSSSSTDSTSTSTDDDPDMTSADFMSLLKSNLQTAVKDGDTGQAQAMLDALSAGTLTVTDPTAGQSITAWDPSDKASTAQTATSVSEEDWNDFLKAHLARGSDGSLTHNSDGSYTDKVTGNEAYFGQVGNQYYYITWPSASSTTSGTSSTGTTSTSSTNTGA
jgi:hypothetical protein